MKETIEYELEVSKTQVEASFIMSVDEVTGDEWTNKAKLGYVNIRNGLLTRA